MVCPPGGTLLVFMGAGAEVGAGAGGGVVSTAGAEIGAGVEAGARSGIGAEVGARADAGVVGITGGEVAVVAVSVCAGGGAEGGEASEFSAETDSLVLACGVGSACETIVASFFSSTVALTSFFSCLAASALFSVFTTDSAAAVL